MNWNQMVKISYSVDAYDRVVKKMFKDNKYTLGRYRVLHQYTMDICKMEPRIADEIRKSYKSFLRKHPCSEKVVLEAFLASIDLMLSREDVEVNKK